MLGSMEVLGSVFVLRRIAAAHVTTLQAQAQMDPGVTHFQALLATTHARGYLLNVLLMFTGLQWHSLLCGLLTAHVTEPNLTSSTELENPVGSDRFGSFDDVHLHEDTCAGANPPDYPLLRLTRLRNRVKDQRNQPDSIKLPCLGIDVARQNDQTDAHFPREFD
jgi:hypothetical protein